MRSAPIPELFLFPHRVHTGARSLKVDYSVISFEGVTGFDGEMKLDAARRGARGHVNHGQTPNCRLNGSVPETMNSGISHLRASSE